MCVSGCVGVCVCGCVVCVCVRCVGVCVCGHLEHLIDTMIV